MNISASRIVELCPKDVGNTKTCQSYILDLALESIGITDYFETSAMRHGTTNQHNAFNMVVRRLFKNAVWHDEYIPIDDRCGASPDVLIGNIPLDIKCPYTPYKYFELCNSIGKRYLYQLQMQMIATESDIAYLLPYCTRPETFLMDSWEEYPVAIEDRYRLIEVPASDEIQSEIMLSVDKWHPKKLQLIDMLKNAKPLTLEEYFFDSKGGVMYKELKDSSNIFSVDEVFRIEDEFYYIKKR